MPSTNRRFSTGLPFLDRRIDGGLTVGSLLAIVAPPHSQSELLLKQLLNVRRTLYISTHRRESEVRQWAHSGPTPSSELTVIRPDVSGLMENFETNIDEVPPESFVVVDQMVPIESKTRGEYLTFLDELKTELERTDSIGVFHCPATDPDPLHRDLTLSRADQVWQLELLALSREIKNRLLVTKSRFTRALREPIDIVLTDQVQVDTSRRIA